MRRRLLVVADSFYPSMGGSTRVVVESSLALVGRGYEVRVLVGSPDPGLPRVETRDGLEIVRYPVSATNTLKLNVTRLVGSTLAAGRALVGGGFDLVDGHELYGPLGTRLSPSARASTLVTTCHGPLHREFEASVPTSRITGSPLRRAVQPAFVRVYSRWLRFLQSRVLAGSTRCVVLSKFAMGFVHDVRPGFPSHRLRIVPGGVDTARFRPETDRVAVRRGLGLPDRGPLLLTIRRLVPRMGLLPLIDAMPRIISRYPGVRLAIGGQGELDGALRERIDGLGLAGSVMLLGFVPDERLPKYYQCADLFLLPSTSLEGFGLVTVEALACGTPVLASRAAGGSVELLEQVDEGLVVDAPSSACLAQGVIRFLEAHLGDSDFRERCRAQGECYSWDTRARRLEALHDEVLSGAGAA